mmetsp:Transcript_117104/g.343032  ORF Transcript_117104/g.343032 Transcript_117104/m.343032 type:complete len:224 (-) Transcript_117104:88-759(-)
MALRGAHGELGKKLAQVPVYALIPHNGPVLAVARPSDRAVREVAEVLHEPLDVGRRYTGNLEAGVLLEDVIREGGRELVEVGGLQEVYKRITDVCSIVDVHWKVEEVVRVSKSCFVYLLKETVLRVLVRDVAKHGRGDRLPWIAFHVGRAKRVWSTWYSKGMVRAESSPRGVVARRALLLGARRPEAWRGSTFCRPRRATLVARLLLLANSAAGPAPTSAARR